MRQAGARRHDGVHGADRRGRGRPAAADYGVSCRNGCRSRRSPRRARVCSVAMVFQRLFDNKRPILRPHAEEALHTLPRKRGGYGGAVSKHEGRPGKTFSILAPPLPPLREWRSSAPDRKHPLFQALAQALVRVHFSSWPRFVPATAVFALHHLGETWMPGARHDDPRYNASLYRPRFASGAQNEAGVFKRGCKTVGRSCSWTTMRAVAARRV